MGRESLGRRVDGTERIIPADTVNRGARSGRVRKASDLVGVAGSGDAVAYPIGHLPGAHSTIVASGPQGMTGPRPATAEIGGRDSLLLAVQRPDRPRLTVDAVRQISTETQADDEAIAAPGGPDDADLLMRDRRRLSWAHLPALHHPASFDVPQLDGAVGAGRDHTPGVARPGDTENATSVLAVADLRHGFARPSIVQPHLSIGADADQAGPVGTEGDAIDEAVMVASQAGVEAVRYAMIEDEGDVIAGRRRP